MDQILKIYERFSKHPHITTDSRKVEQGDIFFALKGDNFNGNKFAATALDAGASFAVIDEEDFFVSADDRYILVEDVLTTLQQLARHHRRTVNPTILAITGTNGKTTTKELTAAVLSKKFENLSYTRGNLNNHIGVPLTLLSIPSDCKMAIVEMGASACGEIELLCSIAEPNYGLITNIGNAHLEGFGGPEGVKKGKGELYEFLAAHEGVCFVREEDSVLIEIADKKELNNRIKYSGKEGEKYDSNLIGEYNKLNIAAAVAVGRHFGVSEEDIKCAIGCYVPTNNRSQRRETEHNTLIIDCYNANPSSMKASIENFRALQNDLHPEKIMILGDMLELGDWSHNTHKEILELALESDCKKIFLVGKNFAAAAEEFTESKERVSVFQNKEILLDALAKSKPTNATILIKGSHSIGLEHCINLF